MNKIIRNDDEICGGNIWMNSIQRGCKTLKNKALVAIRGGGAV